MYGRTKATKFRKTLFIIFTLVLVKYVRDEQRMDCVVEAFRVLGNLSRSNKIRDLLMKCKG